MTTQNTHKNISVTAAQGSMTDSMSSIGDNLDINISMDTVRPTKHHRLSFALGLVLSVSCGNPKGDKATETQQPSSLVEIQFDEAILRADELWEDQSRSPSARIYTDTSYSGIETTKLRTVLYALQWPQDAIIDGLLEGEDWDGTTTYEPCVVEVELIAAPEQICSPKYCNWSFPLAQVATHDGCHYHPEFPFDGLRVRDFSLFIDLDTELELDPDIEGGIW
jgi:hypothetical protein